MSGFVNLARNFSAKFASKNSLFTFLVVLAMTMFTQSASAASSESYEDFDAAAEIASIPKPKSMIIQDLSGSMYGNLKDGVKFEIAQNALRNAITSLDGEIDLGLIAYGHRVKGSCTDIEVVSEIREGNSRQLMSFVNNATPKGRTPLAASLRKAGQILSQNGAANQSIILFTDGLESCQGNPCAEAQALVELGIDVKAHVIGFDLSEEQQAQLRCVAEVTGGEFIIAGNEGELIAAFQKATDLAKKGILQKEIDLLRAALRKLKGDYSDLTTAKNASDASNLDLKGQLSDAGARIKSLEDMLNGKGGDLKDALARIAQLERDLRSMTLAKQAVEAELASTSKELNSTKNELQQLRDEMAALKSKLGATEDMLMSSRAAVKAWNKKAVSLETDLENANSVIANNELAMANQQRDIEGLMGDKKRLGGELVAMRTTNGDLNDKLRVALRTIETQSTEIAGLTANTDRLNKDVADLVNANENLNTRFVEVSSLNSALENEVDLKDAQRLAANDKANALRRQLLDQGKQNAKLIMDNGKLSNNLDDAVDQLAARANDLDLKDGEVSELSNQVVVLSTGLKQAIGLSQQLEKLLRSKQNSMAKAVERNNSIISGSNL